MTEVINIKHAPPGWQSNPEYIYIGRPGIYGNIHPVEDNCPVCRNPNGFSTIHERGEACRQHWLEVGQRPTEELRAFLQPLVNKKLVCFCKPLLCHGDNYIYYINQLGLENND